MQVSVETTQGLERKMTIAVPSEKVDSAVNTRLQEAARNVKLNGFRQGKVPYKVIKSKFGAGVRQEVVGELMSQGLGVCGDISGLSRNYSAGFLHNRSGEARRGNLRV